MGVVDYPQISRWWLREAHVDIQTHRMYPGTDHDEELHRLALHQRGVIHRDQFRMLGVSPAYVTSHLDALRWTAIGQNVVLLQNAPPLRDQLMWLAVLDAGEDAALGSHTSLELAGFKTSSREAAEIHLIVQRGSRATPMSGVRVHESRRLRMDDAVRTRGLPRTETARSVLDAAAWQPFPRFACLMVAAAVQQRLTTAARLDKAMQMVGRIRHKAYLRLAIADVGEGAESLGEIDLARLCRKFGLAAPTRQSQRRDTSGRWRYLDAEWDLPSGEIVVLEVDGRHHLEVVHWQADMKRERSIVISRRWVLRATVFELRLEAASVFSDLRAMGVPVNAELSASQRAIAS
jgi:hypothetical protein